MKAADQVRSAAFFVGFLVSLPGLRKFNQFVPLRCSVQQVTVIQALTEFNCPFSLSVPHALSATHLSPCREP